MTQIQNLSILSWNSRSLYSNLAEFKIYLYVNKPHLACICETWLKESREPCFVGYSPYFKHRTDRLGGGLLILVRNDLCVIEKQLNIFQNGNLEIQAVSLYGKEKIDVFNLYNPSRPVTKEEFMFYFNQLNTNSIVVGDFNGHHILWDQKTSPNRTGNNLVEALIAFNNLELLTPVNSPTYCNVHTNTT